MSKSCANKSIFLPSRIAGKVTTTRNLRGEEEQMTGRKGETIWTKRKTEKDPLANQGKSTSAFLIKIEERREEKVHMLTAGGDITAEVMSQQQLL